MKVNGKEFSLNPNTKKSLLNFLEEMGINAQTVAVELNGDIINREDWSKTFLQNSDKIEIIKFVGGG